MPHSQNKSKIRKGTMKVLFLHPPLYPVNIRFFNILGGHVNLKVFVFGRYPRYHPSWHIDILKEQVKTFDIEILGKDYMKPYLSYNPMFLKKLLNEDADIVVSIAFWPISLYTALLKKILHTKFVILTDATQASEEKIGLIKSVYRKFLASLTDAFIAASSDSVNYLKTLLPSNRWNDIYLSRQTIDIERWSKIFSEIENKENLRKKWNIPFDKVVILGVGGLTTKKNWGSVIKTLPSLSDDIIFLLVGDGDQKLELQRLVANLKVNERVFLVGRKEGKELVEFYKLSDIFILPSLFDQFGFVVVEALSSGLPVLCSQYAGANCFIKDGFNGFLINPSKDYSNEILKILPIIDVMKKNAMESVKEFTLEHRVKEFVEILNKIGNKKL